MHIKNLFNKVVLSFLAILLGVLTLNAQTPLYTGVLVSDVGTSNNIGQANTSRNIAVDAVGNIGVVYVGSAGLRFAKSVNRGQSFLPSVQLLSTATSGNCEVEVADNGNIYVIYSNGSQLQLFISLDGGATFTGPNNLGTGSTPHIASYGSNVYVVPQNGSVVYRNSNNGVGAFSSVSLGSSWVYADIRVDKANGDVYMIADNPTLYMFRSTNSGATFSPVTISGSVFYSSYAITTGPLGKFIYAAGGSNANGYRIDFATGSSTLLTVGTSAVAQGRTLLADEFGNFVDGYAPTTSSVAIRVSGDRGTTFGAPITIANATTHNIVRNASTQDVDIVYQGTDGKIYLAAYPNLLKGLTVSNVNAFYCAGATGTLNYSATGALLNSGNQFIVQLSDKNRSFANPTTIGSISSTNATGTINFTIPDTVSSGTQYRIRVISTNTAVTGADNLFDISINPTPVANITTSGATSICEGSPVLLASSAGNSYLWSNGATTSSISVNVPGTYTVTVGNGCGLTATSAPITVNVTPKPVINVTGSLTLCGTGASVGLSSSTTGTAYLWSNGATTQSITATTAGTYTVRVTGGGCTLTSSPVTVVVNTLPTVSVAKTDETCVGASNGTITINATGTATPFQYSINGGNSFVSNNSFTNLSPGTYTVIVKTAGGCTTTGQQVTIGVTPDVTAPVPTVATLPVINRRCAVTVTTIPTATDNCSGVVNATTESNLNFTTDGTYTIIWKYKDAAGNETTQTQTVIVSSPKIGVSGAANNIPNGNTATIVADNTDFGTMQPSVSISKSFTIQNTGTQPLTITAVNSSNNAFTVSALSLPLVIPAGANESFSIGFNSATVGVQQATITINSDDCNDTSYTYAVKATVVCIDPTFLNTNINIQNATTANSCDAVVNYPLSVTGAPAPNVSYTFSGATIGAGVGTGSGQTFNKGITHVVVTATNICTTTTTEFDVVVVDSTLPIATSQNITVQLGANGTASITAAQVNNGSSDNCGIASIAVDKTSFDCSNVGANTVTLTVTDVNGNSSTATAVVTVVDNILPIATSQNITVQLGANGTASITAAQVNNGSTDNCGIASISVNKTTFDCSNVGANTVTLTVTDVNGNSNTATAVVTVVDNIQPIATSQNITVQLGANGTASITAAQVNNGSTDNCGIASISVNKTSFDCSNVGANTVTLTVTDVNGNSSTATATVTVVDNIAPTITAPANITVNTNLNCTATGVVLGTPVSADNCTVQSVTNNAPAAFPIGNTTVTWIVTDASGRTAAATQVVTVKDATAPTPQLATLPDITGQCSVTVSTVPKANDNCSGIINATTTSPLVYSAQGTYTITWRYTDAAGNISTQTQKVIVKDDTPPVINCPAPITVTAPANQCGATVTYSTPTVSDNCGGGNTGVQTLTSGAQFFDYADNRMETQNSPGLPMTFVPTDGQKLAVFLVNCGSTHYMYQNVTLPSSGPINLGLDMKYTNHFTGGFSTSQFIAIELRNPSTNAIIATLFKTNPGAAQSTPMTHYNFDLSAYAGQQVRLQVVDAVINNFFIDVQLDNITIPGSSLVNGSFETGDYTGWTIGSASTSCGTFGIGSGPSLSVVQKEGLPSGSVFPIGTTTNTFEVTDLAGNKTTCSFNVTVNAPEISISGNGTEIVSGDNTPSTTDHTDLGGTIPGTAISKTYVIANNGTSALIINSINSNNAAFTRSGISLPATIQPGQTASFTISFNATALGTQTAVISVGNTDCNEANYSFAVKAEVTCTNPVFINLNPQVQANTTASSCVAIVNYPLAITGIPAPGLSYTFSGATTGSGSGTGTGNTFNKGTTHVIVTAVNPCSTVLYEFDVIVSDITAPIAIAQNITVNLNANGAATITAAQINNGSSDNCGIASIALDKTSFDCSNVGANTVTLTVTDVNGNSSTATALVTVVDNINPTITAPANIAQGTDAGVCGATVNLGTPVTADNCSIATVSNNAPTLFPVGTTIVTWTVTDVNGNSSTATQTVVITDTEKPGITAPAMVSVVNAAGTCSATVNLGTPVTSDNCGLATVTNNAPALFPVGTTIVTWTVTDIHGNVTDTATQMVVVIDNDLPTISVNNISVNNDAGKCGAGVSIPMPVTGDNCGVASVMGVRSDNKLLTEDYPVGTTTITWTVRDVNGNMKTISQTIKVMDNEKPVIACATNQVFCANTGGNSQYTIAALNQSDNCGIAGTTYVITGATNRTGTGTNASGSFAIGTSTVTFTVTDIHGNVSSCSFTVRINPLPVASITAATANALCNQFTLTANSSLSGPYSYQWLYNNTTKATTQELSLGLSDADGVYSVYTTDANGCRSELAATYNYQKQNLVSSYTILGMKEVKLGQYDKVETGSVGVMSSRGEAEFDKYSSVTGAGSFVKAPRIDTDRGVTINSKIYGVASVTLPTMQYNLSNTRYLQDRTINSNVTATVAGNYDEVTLKKGSNVTLTGTVFGKIKLEEGASVRFTATTLDVEEIQIEKGPKSGGYSYLRFAPNTSIRVSKKVTIGSDVIVNPEAYQVTFYMADNRRDEEKFHVKGDDTRITANIILPDGKLKVTGGNYGDDRCDHRPHSSNSCRHRGHGHHDCDHRGHGDRDCRDDVFMTGLFIAEEVESEGKNVIWNSYNCAAPSAPVTALASNSNQASVREEATASSKLQATGRTEEELKVTVMPNPSTTYFTLKLESRNDAPVTLRVVDGAGRVVDSRAKIGSNSTIQIGHNYHAGNYFAELVQGNRRKTIQLIKVR